MPPLGTSRNCTPETLSSRGAAVRSAGRSSPQRNTTGGSPQPAAPAGAGALRCRRSKAPSGPPSSCSGSAASSRAQSADPAAGAGTVARPSGPRGWLRTSEAAMSTPTTNATTRASAITNGQRGMPADRAVLPDITFDRSSGQVNYGTGQRAGDALDVLHSGHYELTELIHIGGLCTHDHVVRTGDVLRAGHAGQARHLRGHRGSLAHLGLDEDVCLDHGSGLPSRRIMWGLYVGLKRGIGTKPTAWIGSVRGVCNRW